jgi:hypothetical protein
MLHCRPGFVASEHSKGNNAVRRQLARASHLTNSICKILRSTSEVKYIYYDESNDTDVIF